MMKIIIIVLTFFPFCSFAQTIAEAEITIENTGDAKKASSIVIDLNTLGIDKVRSAIIMDKDVEIPYQLDDLNGDGQMDELFFQSDLAKKEKKTIQAFFFKDSQTKFFEKKVHAQLKINDKSQKFPNILSISVPGSTSVTQTYSMMYHHGVAFESEINGFRLYFDNRQSVDLYGKIKRRLELATTNFYSKKFMDKGYGCDVLWAGKSVGLGSFRGWDGKNPTYIDSVAVRSQSIIANGPLRTIVEVKDEGWYYMGTNITMTQRYTQTASHRDVKVDIIFDKEPTDMLFSTGVQKMESDNTGFVREDGLCASWGSNLAEKGDTISFPREWLGLGTYVPKKNIKQSLNHEDNYLYVIKSEKQMTYYITFAARKEEDGFKDMKEWTKELERWKNDLETPIKITTKIKKI